ncbi:MAG: response regulator [Deltaproteobacteria bacterium]|nr:response regulator [Deltaproteobacteria bacterium]
MTAKRILVVEDEEELNELLAYNLRKAGYEVTQTFDGAHALTLIAEDPPDLLLLDIMLPGQDGWSVCRALAKQGAELPTIIFTAKGAREEFDQARDFPNVRGYFMKPYATADVLRHVERVLPVSGS